LQEAAGGVLLILWIQNGAGYMKLNISGILWYFVERPIVHKHMYMKVVTNCEGDGKTPDLE